MSAGLRKLYELLEILTNNSCFLKQQVLTNNVSGRWYSEKSLTFRGSQNWVQSRALSLAGGISLSKLFKFSELLEVTLRAGAENESSPPVIYYTILLTTSQNVPHQVSISRQLEKLNELHFSVSGWRI